jgi:hypothetical protein
MRRFMLWSISLFLLQGGANAVTVKGAKSCAEWSELRQANASQKLSELTTKFWIAGYLSGLAGAQADILRNDPLKELPNEKIYAFIDQFCSHNPNKSLQDATVELWLDVAKFKKKKP